MVYKKILNFVSAGYLMLAGNSAGAQAIDPPGRLPGGSLELAVLDDSSNTWHKALGVVDGGNKGDPVSVGLRTASLTVRSAQNNGRFNKVYDRDDLIYCVIDRDTGAVNGECHEFPPTGTVKLDSVYTDGWFSLYLEAETDNPKNFVRLDEYFRLPKPEGTLRFRKADVSGGKGSMGDIVPIIVKQRERIEMPRGRNSADRVIDPFGTTGESADSRRVSVSGGSGHSVSAPRPSYQVVVPNSIVKGVSFALRLGAEPFSYQNNTLPNSRPRVESDGFSIATALGYAGNRFAFGGFADFARRGFSLNELGTRVSFGTNNSYRDLEGGLSFRADLNKGGRLELGSRLSAGIIWHELNYGIGDIADFRENAEPFGSFILDVDATLPRLIVNRRNINIGLVGNFSLDSLGNLTQKHTSNPLVVKYGRKNERVVTGGLLVGTNYSIYASLGMQFNSIPTLRLRDNVEIAADGSSLDLSESTRGNFTGRQLFLGLHIPRVIGNYNLNLGGSLPAAGAISRSSVSASLGGKHWRFKYDYEDNSLRIDDAIEAKERRHLFSLEAATDLDRLLLPTRRIVSRTLR